MKNTYIIELDKKRIGYTEFEFENPPMGVVHGKIIFNNLESPYELFRNHCLKHGC